MPGDRRLTADAGHRPDGRGLGTARLLLVVLRSPVCSPRPTLGRLCGRYAPDGFTQLSNQIVRNQPIHVGGLVQFYHYGVKALLLGTLDTSLLAAASGTKGASTSEDSKISCDISTPSARTLGEYSNPRGASPLVRVQKQFVGRMRPVSGGAILMSLSGSPTGPTGVLTGVCAAISLRSGKDQH